LNPTNSFFFPVLQLIKDSRTRKPRTKHKSPDWLISWIAPIPGLVRVTALLTLKLATEAELVVDEYFEEELI